MPTHAALAALGDDYAGEQHAPKRQPADNPLDALRGKPQLLQIAQFDPGLALQLAALVDLVEEADFNMATAVAEDVARRLNLHRRRTTPDGVVISNH